MAALLAQGNSESDKYRFNTAFLTGSDYYRYPNDLSTITDEADIKAIFTTGKAAYKYYCRFQQESTGIEAICLPSTSPANARFGLDALIDEYKIIKNYL